MEIREDNTRGAIEKVIQKEAERGVIDGIISEAEYKTMVEVGKILDDALVEKEDQ